MRRRGNREPDDSWAGSQRGSRGPLLRGVLLLLALVGVAAAWQWTGLGESLDLETLVEWETSLRESPAAPLIVIGAYVAGGFVLVPVTLLTVATVIVFGLVPGYLYALSGCLVSGSLTYGLGRMFGADTAQRLAGRRVAWFRRQAGRHGLMTVVAVRIFPVGPFTIVNLIVGASGIRFRDFLAGTLLGMTPGLVGLVGFAYGLRTALTRQGLTGVAILAALVVLIGAAAVWVRRQTSRHHRLIDHLPGPPEKED